MKCPIRWLGRGVVLDILLVVMLVVFNVYVAVWSGLPQEGRPGCGPWAGLVLQVVVALAMLARRTRPLAVLGVVAVSAVVMSLSMWLVPGWFLASADGAGVWVPSATPFAAYSAVVFSARPRVAWVLTGVLTLLATRLWALSFAVTASGLVLTAVPALLGMYVGARRGLIAVLTERAERAERERVLVAEQARAEERVRLAGEMHDVVTHRVSLMVLQAGALCVTASDAHARAEAEALRAAGCQALEELRDLVGVLRSPRSAVKVVGTAERDVSGSGPGLAMLVAESRAVGMEVEFREVGDGSVLAPVVARTAHRIVQEALTNVRKHAPGGSVRVDVRYEVDRVRLLVRNTAPTKPGDVELAASGSGSGLSGLRQRTELVGGTFASGPLPDGGFTVESALPTYVPTTKTWIRSGQPAASGLWGDDD
ncbi:sensor histidine kinase [Streptomyces sporangiiformans]|uniref:sensor histidine kinase n=1 Tax=Streptomyces sporangiiformans TaxID=2315329 RepID=UPI0013C403FC|nr:histidine kinase [Streptomyces sporangiiformans]